MKIDKSYAAISLFNYISKYSITRLSTENLDFLLDTIIDEIYDEYEINFSLNNDMNTNQSFTSELSISEKYISINPNNHIPLYMQLFKCKKVNQLNDYLLFDKYFNRVLDSEYITEALNRVHKDIKKESTKHIEDALVLYTEIIEHYRKLKSAEENEQHSLYEQEHKILCNLQRIKEELINDILYNYVSLEAINILYNEKPDTYFDIKNPNIVLSKFINDVLNEKDIIDMEQKQNIVESMNFKGATAVSGALIDIILKEIVTDEYFNILNTFIKNNPLNFGRSNFIELKYAILVYSTQYERKFLNSSNKYYDDKTVNKNVVKQAISYTNIYENKLKQLTNYILEKNNDYYKDNDCYMSVIDKCILLQAYLNTSPNKRIYSTYQDIFKAHKNSDKNNYSISNFMLKELVTNPEQKGKTKQKKLGENN